MVSAPLRSGKLVLAPIRYCDLIVGARLVQVSDDATPSDVYALLDEAKYAMGSSRVTGVQDFFTFEAGLSISPPVANVSVGLMGQPTTGQGCTPRRGPAAYRVRDPGRITGGLHVENVRTKRLLTFSSWGYPELFLLSA
jgi:hypothetical protein